MKEKLKPRNRCWFAVWIRRRPAPCGVEGNYFVEPWIHSDSLLLPVTPQQWRLRGSRDNFHPRKKRGDSELPNNAAFSEVTSSQLVLSSSLIRNGIINKVSWKTDSCPALVVLLLSASPLSHQFNSGVSSKTFPQVASSGPEPNPTVPGPITVRRRGHFYWSARGHFHGCHHQPSSHLVLNYSSILNRQERGNVPSWDLQTSSALTARKFWPRQKPTFHFYCYSADLSVFG